MLTSPDQAAALGAPLGEAQPPSDTGYLVIGAVVAGGLVLAVLAARDHALPPRRTPLTPTHYPPVRR